MTVPHLFCFGFGYTARVLARRLAAEGWIVGGTCRTADKLGAARDRGLPSRSSTATTRCRGKRSTGSRIFSCRFLPMPPATPCWRCMARTSPRSRASRWLGYLSTTGVYGDRGGGWVDESAELSPSGERGRRRVAAEAGWLDLWRPPRRAGAHLPPRRHLRPRPQPLRGAARRHGKTDRQAGPGILPHPCRAIWRGARCLDRPAAARRGL